jgi:hypothetical protein
MAAFYIIRVLAKIPWKEIIKYGPVIIATASSLLSRSKSVKIDPADTIEMAERQEILVQSIQVLDARLKISFLILIILAIGFIYVLFR